MTIRGAGSQCPACGDGEGRAFFRSNLGWSVRSDGTALPASAFVEECTTCGHLFKQAEDTGRWADYERYEAYGDDPGRDKLDFGTGAPVARSAAQDSHAFEPWAKILLAALVPAIGAIYAPAAFKLPLLALTGVLFVVGVVMLGKQERGGAGRPRA